MNERKRLAVALGTLVALQLLHLLDGFRTDEDTAFPDLLLEPQALAGVGGTLVALVAVVRSVRSGRALALAAGSLVALGFAVVHGIPVASEFTEPYWGDGSADALQWLGVLAIWACCAAVVVMAQRRDPE